MPDAHAKYGASSSPIWLHCAGWAGLSSAAEQTSAAAEEGRAAHTAAETCLRKGTVPTDPALRVYVDAVRALHTPDRELHVEVRIDLPFLHPVDAWGTADVLLVRPYSHVHVVDLKYGMGHLVEVEHNSQLAFYALGAAHAAECLDATVTIVQPRAEHVDGPVRTVSYGRQDLAMWRDIFQRAIDAAEGPHPAFTMGEHCRWCKKKVECPAQEHQRRLAGLRDFAIPEVTTVTPDQVARALRARHDIIQYLDTLADMGHTLAKAGKLPGFKLVKGRKGNRAWADPDQAKAALIDAGVAATKEVLLSPAEVEKMVGKKGMQAFTPLVDRAPGSPVLAPIEDPRPALVAPSAAEDFPLLEKP